MNGKKTKTPFNSPNYSMFLKNQSKIHRENCEFVHENGKIVGTKAPNLKKIDKFYKKIAKHNALKNKRK